MKTLRTLFFPALLLLSLAGSAQADTSKKEARLAWYTDAMQAQAISKATNKPLFALFTGSDWCIWCKRLEANVFSKPAFVEWANKNVVLLMLDFPRQKTLSPELTAQNNSLQQTFQVQGYPTVWIFNLNKNTAGNFDIDALGMLGYPQGAEQGKEEVKFISDANALFAKRNVK